MIKTVCIVSLSRGILGEARVKHELDIGVRRLEAYGLNVRFAAHALSGLERLDAHPEERAEDLIQAFSDPEIDLILCAIGGNDTYRLAPYLFDGDALKNALSNKCFLGFSDTTVNHFMLHKLGLKTFYGQAFLPDVCEIGKTMLPYSERYFAELLNTGTIREIRPADTWYENRTSFAPDRVGTELTPHPDRGFELLNGAPVFSGPILGGCIDSIAEMLDETLDDSVGRRMTAVTAQYGLFPSREDWNGRILLLESSEVRMPPETYRRALLALKRRGVFDAVSGVLVGKPMDETYYGDYSAILKEVVGNPSLPIVYNVNVGHAQPRCIVPFGVPATVNVTEQRITFAP
ncbi:MAG: LD-carboxypeptidase [Clostridia bacterium]|nr:LD-carboxypeptidase [Clostridia bacterium]